MAARTRPRTAATASTERFSGRAARDYEDRGRERPRGVRERAEKGSRHVADRLGAPDTTASGVVTNGTGKAAALEPGGGRPATENYGDGGSRLQPQPSPRCGSAIRRVAPMLSEYRAPGRWRHLPAQIWKSFMTSALARSHAASFPSPPYFRRVEARHLSRRQIELTTAAAATSRCSSTSAGHAGGRPRREQSS
jgi:hypothetical protein